MVLSYAVFALMCTHHASMRAVLLLLALCIASGLWRKPKIPFRFPPVRWLFVFVPFGAWYLVYSAAPEVQADPNTYHLMPAVESLRYGGFSSAIAFYNRLPQGIEMLFVPAWRIGGSSAAKLVHLGFLLATLPVIMHLARLWNLPEDAGFGAAALYFCTPVVGFAGASAFNDAALVYFTLAAIALAVADRPWHAGLLAGFCYAVKMTGLLTVPVAIAFFLWRKQWRRGAYVAIAATLSLLPWLGRNWMETGNPLAPFLNEWFPNPYFYVWTEQNLTHNLRDYGVASLWRRIGELLAGSHLHGIVGPVFVLSPLALWAFRKRNGVVLLLLSAVFSIPWWMNAGARFTMTMLPFLALAMCAALGRRAIVTLVSFHAVTAWPAMIGFYSPKALRLRDFPLSAAVRLETEEAYLARTSYDYAYVKMVDRTTPPNAKILDLWGAHAVHSTREFIGSWQSAQAVRLVEGLDFARRQGTTAVSAVVGNFDEQAICGVRAILAADMPSPWAIHQMEVKRGHVRIVDRSTRWVSASKLPWEVPLALDTNPVSRWWTGQPAQRGDYLQIDYTQPVTADSIHLLTPTPSQLRIEVCNRGLWTNVPVRTSNVPELNLRPAAVQMLKQAGITHILTPASFEGIGVLGERLVNTADDWGLEVVGNLHAVYLLKVR
jgi:hypothetical protein